MQKNYERGEIYGTFYRFQIQVEGAIPDEPGVLGRSGSKVQRLKGKCSRVRDSVSFRTKGYRVTSLPCLSSGNDGFCYCEESPTYPTRTRVHHRDTGYDRSWHRPAFRRPAQPRATKSGWGNSGHGRTGHDNSCRLGDIRQVRVDRHGYPPH